MKPGYEGDIKIVRTVFILTLSLCLLSPVICLAEKKEVASLSSSYFNAYFSRSVVKQGDVVLVTVISPIIFSELSGDLNNNRVFFNRTGKGKEYTGILGIDMNLAPGVYCLRLTGSINGTSITSNVEFEIKERKYETETLAFPENLVELDKESEERAEREGAALTNIWKEIGPERLWIVGFKPPVKGRSKNNFGKRRILNGKEKSPHNGVDIIAPAGRKIFSANNGRVALTDEQFFGGKTVVIDHGQGLFTTYLHLSKILVDKGEIVNKGAVIGLVGSTGRSKKPHLHWSARVNNARVDPLLLLSLF